MIYYDYDSIDEVDLYLLKGEKGIKGETGDVGPTGDTGDDGDTGESASTISQSFAVCNSHTSDGTKIISIDNFNIIDGALLVVDFKESASGEVRLSFTEDGANSKPILYYETSTIPEGIINANTLVTFVYDSTNDAFVYASREPGSSVERTVESALAHPRRTDMSDISFTWRYIYGENYLECFTEIPIIFDFKSKDIIFQIPVPTNFSISNSDSGRPLIYPMVEAVSGLPNELYYSIIDYIDYSAREIRINIKRTTTSTQSAKLALYLTLRN